MATSRKRVEPYRVPVAEAGTGNPVLRIRVDQSLYDELQQWYHRTYPEHRLPWAKWLARLLRAGMECTE